jgi:hypothetical protein
MEKMKGSDSPSQATEVVIVWSEYVRTLYRSIHFMVESYRKQIIFQQAIHVIEDSYLYFNSAVCSKIKQFVFVDNWSIEIELTRNVRGESPLNVVMALFPSFRRKLEVIFDMSTSPITAFAEKEVDCVLRSISSTHLTMPYIEFTKESRVATTV